MHMTTITSHATSLCTQARTHGSLQQLMSAVWLKQVTMAFAFVLQPNTYCGTTCMLAHTLRSKQWMSIMWRQPSL